MTFMLAVLGSILFWVLYGIVTLFCGTLAFKIMAPQPYRFLIKGELTPIEESHEGLDQSYTIFTDFQEYEEWFVKERIGFTVFAIIISFIFWPVIFMSIIFYYIFIKLFIVTLFVNLLKKVDKVISSVKIEFKQ